MLECTGHLLVSITIVSSAIHCCQQLQQSTIRFHCLRLALHPRWGWRVMLTVPRVIGRRDMHTCLVDFRHGRQLVVYQSPRPPVAGRSDSDDTFTTCTRAAHLRFYATHTHTHTHVHGRPPPSSASKIAGRRPGINVSPHPSQTPPISASD
jgi:hypothetical protein